MKKNKKDKLSKILKNKIKDNKKSFIVYMILRFLVIICMIREVMIGNYSNALLCVLSLILFLVPAFFERKFKVEIPALFEIIIMLFIFSAEILGEINNFYHSIPYWDTILHTLNGFLCASVGFSLVYLLNENSKQFNLSPIFVTLVAFCFSMTIGVLWEFFEYGMDVTFKTDMQKDTFISEVYSVEFDPKLDNNVISIKDIDSTIIYNEDGDIIRAVDNYLDVGLHDTMADLIVNFIGAVVFSFLGYLYLKNQEKHKLAGRFIIHHAI